MSQKSCKREHEEEKHVDETTEMLNKILDIIQNKPPIKEETRANEEEEGEEEEDNEEYWSEDEYIILKAYYENEQEDDDDEELNRIIRQIQQHKSNERSHNAMM